MSNNTTPSVPAVAPELRVFILRLPNMDADPVAIAPDLAAAWPLLIGALAGGGEACAEELEDFRLGTQPEQWDEDGTLVQSYRVDMLEGERVVDGGTVLDHGPVRPGFVFFV